MNGQPEIGLWDCPLCGFTVDGECSAGGWHSPEILVIIDPHTVATLIRIGEEITALVDNGMSPVDIVSELHRNADDWRRTVRTIRRGQ